jgi:glycosyltransferase involved in cell wall biosynthesis
VTPRKQHPFVVALVPAHDEEATVARTVKSLSTLDRIDWVVVVADGCADATVQEALGAGATVLAAPRRKGKGGALEQVLDRLPKAEVYLFVDGDVGDTAVEVARLLDPVLAGSLDVAIGRLPALEGGGFGIVKRMAARMIRLAGGFEAGAPLSGQRALTREALEACRPLAPGFGVETAMSMDLTRLGLRVEEVPVEMSHRATGRGIDGFIHRGRQGLEILAAALPRLAGLR